MQNEADKLLPLHSPERISREATDRLVSATVEAEVFSLSKAILARDYAKAQGILSALLYLREPGSEISSMC